MSSPKDIVLNAWKIFSSRDAERIAALFTDDAEWIAPKGNATAVALDHTDHMAGPHQIARFIAQEMHKMFSNIDIAFRGVYADGDVVIVEERMRATLGGGKPYENDYCFVFTVSGDRISAGAGIHGYAQGMADGLRAGGVMHEPTITAACQPCSRVG
ncbi:nuclear transport factor 2 family protein [Bradyrhizobium genomosp. III]|uniref:nuclear transport factor 2 family protein n=1 Tax=Bradyrhizobium genomosp. III TaxID=2683271 RepID=UPI0004BB3DF7|nr:nuclear transport factor 2 family protein [Bradyrhizobium sp. CCBAU 15635]